MFASYVLLTAVQALLVDRESTRADEIAQRKYLDEFQKLYEDDLKKKMGETQVAPLLSKAAHEPEDVAAAKPAKSSDVDTPVVEMPLMPDFAADDETMVVPVGDDGHIGPKPPPTKPQGAPDEDETIMIPIGPTAERKPADQSSPDDEQTFIIPIGADAQPPARGPASDADATIIIPVPESSGPARTATKAPEKKPVHGADDAEGTFIIPIGEGPVAGKPDTVLIPLGERDVPAHGPHGADDAEGTFIIPLGEAPASAGFRGAPDAAPRRLIPVPDSAGADETVIVPIGDGPDPHAMMASPNQIFSESLRDSIQNGDGDSGTVIVPLGDNTMGGAQPPASLLDARIESLKGELAEALEHKAPLDKMEDLISRKIHTLQAALAMTQLQQDDARLHGDVPEAGDSEAQLPRKRRGSSAPFLHAFPSLIPVTDSPAADETIIVPIGPDSDATAQPPRGRGGSSAPLLIPVPDSPAADETVIVPIGPDPSSYIQTKEKAAHGGRAHSKVSQTKRGLPPLTAEDLEAAFDKITKPKRGHH